VTPLTGSASGGVPLERNPVDVRFSHCLMLSNTYAVRATPE
jgi:hypothetical protein